MLRVILHVDMDAFFASVEQNDDPALRECPVLVGGTPPRGVVAAASYEARRFGVRSAMPMIEACRLCPNAVVVAPRLARYREVSQQIFEIFREFTPDVEGLSLDEAFLDVTASQRLFGGGEAIARTLKELIREHTGLTASAGVAPSKFVAKLASDLEKPDGLVVIPAAEVRSRLAPLPVERMWGVGPVAARKLRSAGIRTLGAIQRADPEQLGQLLGTYGAKVFALASGTDPRPVCPRQQSKSVGSEETLMHDIYSGEEVRLVLLSQAVQVARRLVLEDLSASVVLVKIKYADFQQRTRQKQLEVPVRDAVSIHEACGALLPKFPSFNQGVRLVGVSTAGLSLGPPPPQLFPDCRGERREALQRTLTELEARVGKDALVPASLLARKQQQAEESSRS